VEAVCNVSCSQSVQAQTRIVFGNAFRDFLFKHRKFLLHFLNCFSGTLQMFSPLCQKYGNVSVTLTFRLSGGMWKQRRGKHETCMVGRLARALA
jgi:hypothetical protein